MRRSTNEIPKLHIKRGDEVKLLSGDDKGKTGRVLVVNPTERTALVEGINLVTKHVKPNQKTPSGERVQREAAVHVSKLQLIDPKTKTPTRVGRTLTDKGWVRVTKKSNTTIN